MSTDEGAAQPPTASNDKAPTSKAAPTFTSFINSESARVLARSLLILRREHHGEEICAQGCATTTGRSASSLYLQAISARGNSVCRFSTRDQCTAAHARRDTRTQVAECFPNHTRKHSVLDSSYCSRTCSRTILRGYRVASYTCNYKYRTTPARRSGNATRKSGSVARATFCSTYC